MQLTYTPTQARMMQVLADGLPHKRSELIGCLYDTMGDAANVGVHITYLRRKLKAQGLNVICERTDKVYYRLVRHIENHSDS